MWYAYLVVLHIFAAIGVYVVGTVVWSFLVMYSEHH